MKAFFQLKMNDFRLSLHNFTIEWCMYGVYIIQYTPGFNIKKV